MDKRVTCLICNFIQVGEASRGRALNDDRVNKSRRLINLLIDLLETVIIVIIISHHHQFLSAYMGIQFHSVDCKPSIKTEEMC